MHLVSRNSSLSVQGTLTGLQPGWGPGLGTNGSDVTVKPVPGDAIAVVGLKKPVTILYKTV